ncbi:hypothetical protein ACLOJK_010915 [Asimina triloba]
MAIQDQQQHNKENKVSSTMRTMPNSPFQPTIFPSPTRVGLAAAAAAASSRRQKVGHAHHGHRLRRQSKKTFGGCCKQLEPAMNMDGCDDETEGSEDEKIGVERRIKALRGLVPGGDSLGQERLFEETAEYILALQLQVHALKMLASFFEGREKDQTKVGA